MKKFFAFLLTFMALLGLVSCGSAADKLEQKPVETPGKVEYSKTQYEYFVPMTMDTIFGYSTNLVKASLVAIEDFNGSAYVYLFDVEEDYTKNTEAQIHMYDSYDDQYIIGHSYYLFLSSANDALYPHTIYTTVFDKLILDATGNMSGEIQLEEDEGMLRIQDAEVLMKNAVAQGVVGVEASKPMVLSNEDDITTVSQEADLVLKVKVSEEREINRYVSDYQIEVIEILSGPENYNTSIMSLPPNLENDGYYYVFLEKIPGEENNYALSSRQLPVVPVTEEATQSLSLD